MAVNKVGRAAFLLMRKGVVLCALDMDGRKPIYRPMLDPDEVVEYAKETDKRVVAARRSEKGLRP